MTAFFIDASSQRTELDTTKLSSRAQRGCGFPFEVQHLGEDLSWRLEVQTLSWRVVVGVNEAREIVRRESVEIGLARQEASESANGVFDAAFLPRGMRRAEEGRQSGPLVQAIVLGELGAIVEGQGAAKALGQGPEQFGQGSGGGLGAPAVGLDEG